MDESWGQKYNDKEWLYWVKSKLHNWKLGDKNLLKFVSNESRKWVI